MCQRNSSGFSKGNLSKCRLGCAVVQDACRGDSEIDSEVNSEVNLEADSGQLFKSKQTIGNSIVNYFAGIGFGTTRILLQAPSKADFKADFNADFKANFKAPFISKPRPRLIEFRFAPISWEAPGDLAVDFEVDLDILATLD